MLNLIKPPKAIMMLLFMIFVSQSYAQVDCNQITSEYTGKCEGYNRLYGYRSTKTYKKGKLHGVAEESYSDGQVRYHTKYSKGFINGKFIAYYKSGEQMTVGKFKSGTGNFIMYHSNGALKITGSFYQGVVDGIWTSYDESGALLDTLNRSAMFPASMLDYLVGDSKMRAPREDFFSEMFDLDNFFGGNSDSMISNIENQIKEAMEKMKQMFEEMEFSDTTVHFNFSDSTGSYEHIEFFDGLRDHGYENRVNGLVDFPDIEPIFPGGEDARNEFVHDNIIFPNGFLPDAKSETIFVEVIIDSDGSILQPQIALKGTRELEIEALRVVKSMPNWIPAEHHGEKVKTRTIIPIVFDRAD